MIERARPILLFALVFATVALLGYTQVWAQSVTGLPCETVRVFDEQIRVTFNKNCENVLDVEFCDTQVLGFCTAWSSGLASKVTNPYVCICTVDSPAPDGPVCDTDDFANNLNVNGLTVTCHRMKKAGALGRGCPYYGSRGYLYAGDAYSRP